VGAPQPPGRREAGSQPDLRVARVLPDVAALAARAFDYLVPASLAAEVRVGSIVRVPLHGRRVRGWVVALPEEAETGRRLLPIAKVSSVGPPADVLALAEWAAWRWAGPVTRFLRTASPPGAVRELPPAAGPGRGPPPRRAAGHAVEVVRAPPAADPFPVVEEAARGGDALVLAPSLGEAAMVAARLRRAGVPVAVAPREWARAAAGGCTVVGARAAAWAPVPGLAAVVVIDEHDEVYQEERAPTWNARDVAVERARRAGAPCWLTSPCPSLAALALAGGGSVRAPSRSDERAGWPVLEVVDRRDEAPGLGLYSERLVALLRAATPEERVVCVLNRKGRAVLMACAACGELARCERCDGPLESGGELGMRCRRCGLAQPPVCRWCGVGRFKALRIGVARVRDELELLAGQAVAEVTGDTPPAGPGGGFPAAAVLVGTSAVLHRAARAAVVAFLDFDQELLAPRFRAGEEALALLARAGRVAGGREGRVLVQTRAPGHEVLDAARHADPSRFTVVEGARRAALRMPPEVALARVSGPGAAGVVAQLDGGQLDGVETLGPAGDRWLVRAGDHRSLCDALAAVKRPGERVRVEVDPLRA